MAHTETNLTNPRDTKCSMNNNRKVHILDKKVTRARICVTQISILIHPKSNKIMKNIVFTKSHTIKTLPITEEITRNNLIDQVIRSAITRVIIRCLITASPSSVIITISRINLIIVRPRKAKIFLSNLLVLMPIIGAVETSQTSTEDSNSFRERTTSHKDKSLAHFTAVTVAILNSKHNQSIDNSYLIAIHFSLLGITIRNIGKFNNKLNHIMVELRASTSIAWMLVSRTHKEVDLAWVIPRTVTTIMVTTSPISLSTASLRSRAAATPTSIMVSLRFTLTRTPTNKIFPVCPNCKNTSHNKPIWLNTTKTWKGLGRISLCATIRRRDNSPTVTSSRSINSLTSTPKTSIISTVSLKTAWFLCAKINNKSKMASRCLKSSLLLWLTYPRYGLKNRSSQDW